MINLTIKQIANLLHGKVFGENVSFNEIATDTRKIIPGSIFIALVGKHYDGHDFANQAKEKRACALLVNRRLLDIKLPQLVVKDTKIALGKLAKWIRQQTSAHVVALTGSSGKTSVKEMTASILNQCGSTLYTKDNLNNSIGVPITLLRLKKIHKYAVIELGASRQGEIAYTANLTRPESALVNNFSISHLEGFKTIEEIAKTKGEIYIGLLKNGIAILNSDSNDWSNWKNNINDRKILKFSKKSFDGDITANNIRISSFSSKFTLQTPIGNIKIVLSLPGIHNIENALAATSLAISVGASLSAVQNGLINFKAIPGRLFPIPLNKDQLILDDSYNSNVASMNTAIQVLSNIPGYRVMVVSDMEELGKKSETYHIQIGKIAKVSKIDRILSIGKFSRKISQVSGIGEHFFNKETVIVRLKEMIKRYQKITILVKGSHNYKMEKIIHALKG